MPLSQLTDQGYRIFNQWYDLMKNKESLTSDDFLNLKHQINERGATNILNKQIRLDETKTFNTHYELGQYLHDTLLIPGATDYATYLDESKDSLWDWITIVYIDQLIAHGEVREKSAYFCTEGRNGGGRLYRHRCRTDYEMFSIHGKFSKLVLYPVLYKGGDSREQLVATNWVRNSEPIFQTAYTLFFDDNKQVLKQNVSEIRNLKKWVERLDATYLIDLMTPEEIIIVLPEFIATLK